MSKSISTTTKGGTAVGNLLALIISWSVNHSTGWVIVHTILGWLYVFYYIVFYLFPWGIFIKGIVIIAVIVIGGAIIATNWEEIRRFFTSK